MNYYQEGVIDWGYLVIRPLKSMLAELVGFIPNLLEAFLILIAGWLIAQLCRFLISSFLKSIGFDGVADKIGLVEINGKNGKKIAPNQFVGLMTFWGIMFATFIIMLTSLRLREVSSFLDTLLSYVVTIFTVSIIAVAGIACSMVVRRIILAAAKTAGSKKPELPAALARWSILIFTVIVCLSQIGIRMEVFLLPAAVILVTLCVTFVLAFGFGGRHWAGKVLDKIGQKWEI